MMIFPWKSENRYDFRRASKARPYMGLNKTDIDYFFCASIFSASSVRYIHRSVLCSSWASRSVS